MRAVSCATTPLGGRRLVSQFPEEGVAEFAGDAIASGVFGQRCCCPRIKSHAGGAFALEPRYVSTG